MYCLKCGNKCREDAKFCKNCGAPVVIVTPDQQYNNSFTTETNPNMTQTIPNTTEKKKRKFPKITCSIAAGTLLILLTVILILTKGKGKANASSTFEFVSPDAITIINEKIDGEKYFFLVNGKGDVQYADHQYNIWGYQQSAKQDVIAFHMSSYDKVCVLKDKKLVEISQDAFDYTLSANGSKIAYLEDEEDKCGTLYIRDINKKKPVQIAENVCKDSVVLSPDGNTAAYVENINGEVVMCCVTNGSKAKVYKENQVPIAVSDDGNYLYYVDDDKLFVMSGEEKKKLGRKYGGWSYVNKDCSEILFFDLDQMYLSQNGGDKQLFCPLTHTFLLPEQVTEVTSSSDEYDCKRMGVTSFFDVGYKLRDGYVYIDSEWNEHILCDTEIDDRDIAISASGEEAFYTEDGQLYRKKVKDDGDAVPVGDDDHNIGHFKTDKELRGIYFKNEYDCLEYMNRSGQAIEITEDFADGMMDSIDGTYYFVPEDSGNLYDFYSMKNGSERKRINKTGIKLTDIDYEGPRYIYGNLDEAGYLDEIFMMTGGKSIRILKAEEVKDLVK